jgi:hypothetical protein
MRALRYVLALIVLALLASGAARSDPIPGTQAYRDFYGSFLPPSCCWTNGCCRRVSSREFEPLDRSLTRFRYLPTGQVIERSAWSPDGNFHVCQCDQHGSEWRIGVKTNVRCLAVPAPGS